MVDPQSGSQENEGWFYMSGIITGEIHELVLVDIRIVVCNIYFQIGLLMLFRECPISYISTVQILGLVFCPYCIHDAVAEGPNHSPGYLPQCSAPCLTNRCIENGASGKSAKRDNNCASSLDSVPRRQSV